MKRSTLKVLLVLSIIALVLNIVTVIGVFAGMNLFLVFAFAFVSELLLYSVLTIFILMLLKRNYDLENGITDDDED